MNWGPAEVAINNILTHISNLQKVVANVSLTDEQVRQMVQDVATIRGFGKTAFKTGSVLFDEWTRHVAKTPVGQPTPAPATVVKGAAGASSPAPATPVVTAAAAPVSTAETDAQIASLTAQLKAAQAALAAAETANKAGTPVPAPATDDATHVALANTLKASRTALEAAVASAPK